MLKFCRKIKFIKIECKIKGFIYIQKINLIGPQNSRLFGLDIDFKINKIKFNNEKIK